MINDSERFGIDRIDGEKLYTVGELLQYIPISKSGLYTNLKKCEVPCIKLSNRSLYLGKDFLNFINENRI